MIVYQQKVNHYADITLVNSLQNFKGIEGG